MYEMRIYLLNNTKPYSEDEDGYSGEWFNCPVDFEEVKEKLLIMSFHFLLNPILPYGKSIATAAWCWRLREHLSVTK